MKLVIVLASIITQLFSLFNTNIENINYNYEVATEIVEVGQKTYLKDNIFGDFIKDIEVEDKTYSKTGNYLKEIKIIFSDDTEKIEKIPVIVKEKTKYMYVNTYSGPASNEYLVKSDKIEIKE